MTPKAKSLSGVQYSESYGLEWTAKSNSVGAGSTALNVQSLPAETELRLVDKKGRALSLEQPLLSGDLVDCKVQLTQTSLMGLWSSTLAEFHLPVFHGMEINLTVKNKSQTQSEL